MKKVCSNAYKQYIRSRPGASVESVKRIKEISWDTLPSLPIFGMDSHDESDKISLLNQMKRYRPNGVRVRNYTEVAVTYYKRTRIVYCLNILIAIHPVSC